MTKLACQYAIVRFMPHVETGEFANVGIVVLCQKAHFFGFKLLKKYGRVTRFFENIDARIFIETRRILHAELTRIRAELQFDVFAGGSTNDPKVAQAIFNELTRRREALMHFDAPRVVLAQNPRAALEELYGFYIERDFVTKEYQERLLERGMRNLLIRNNLGDKYTNLQVGNDSFHVRFPFVHMEGNLPAKAIKPFHLAHDDPNKILDHGGHWVDRVKRLKRHGLIPREVLFAIEAPPKAEAKRFAAYQEICGDLIEQDVVVVGASEEERILAFARVNKH